MQDIINLFHEIGMLSQIPRSGFAFLGSGQQSVAEHSYRVALIAFILSKLYPEAIDPFKLVMICLFHDLPEARIGDLNYMQKRYVKANLKKALDDIKTGSPIGPEIVEWIEEYEQAESIEAKIAHDADQLELMLKLKQEYELGNARAMVWFDNAVKRLKTPLAKEISKQILDTSSDKWWMGDQNDPHWINGGKTIVRDIEQEERATEN